MDREHSKRLQQLGFKDAKHAKEVREQHEKMQAEAEQRRQEQMSELEREREQRQQYEEASKREAARAEEAETKARLYGMFATQGVRNMDYAQFRFAQKRAALAEGETLDEMSYLEELMGDPGTKAALTVGGSEPTPAVRPATTTEPTRDVPPPPPGGAQPPATSAFAQSREDFQKSLAQKYNFHGS